MPVSFPPAAGPKLRMDDLHCGDAADASASLRLRLARAAVDVMLSDFQCRRDAARTLLKEWLAFAKHRRQLRLRALRHRHTAVAAARAICLRRAASRWRAVGRWASVGRSVARLAWAARADAARAALRALWSRARDARAIYASCVSRAQRAASRATAVWRARASATPLRVEALARAQQRLARLRHHRLMRGALGSVAAAAGAALRLAETSATATAQLSLRRRRLSLGATWRAWMDCSNRDRRLAAGCGMGKAAASRRSLRTWSAAARWHACGGSVAWLGCAAARSGAVRLAFIRWGARATVRSAFARSTSAMAALHTRTVRRTGMRRLRLHADEASTLETAGVRGRVRALEKGFALWRVRAWRAEISVPSLQAQLLRRAHLPPGIAALDAEGGSLRWRHACALPLSPSACRRLGVRLLLRHGLARLASHSVTAEIANVRWLRLALCARDRRRQQEEAARRFRAERQEAARREWREWQARASTRWQASYGGFAREARLEARHGGVTLDSGDGAAGWPAAGHEMAGAPGGLCRGVQAGETAAEERRATHLVSKYGSGAAQARACREARERK